MRAPLRAVYDIDCPMANPTLRLTGSGGAASYAIGPRSMSWHRMNRRRAAALRMDLIEVERPELAYSVEKLLNLAVAVEVLFTR